MTSVRAVTLSAALTLGLTVLTSAPPASATPTASVGFSPTIFGHRADVNGSDSVTGADDSFGFFGATSVIDGMVDCDAWGTSIDEVNHGLAGDGAIDTDDDCTLVGFDGTPDGVTIEIVDGGFATADGASIPDSWPLPLTFNATDPDDPSVLTADFGWSTIDGRVDVDRSGTITFLDHRYGLVGTINDVGFDDPTDGADVINSNPCRRGCLVPPTENDGLVDLDSDSEITVGDSCARCFFGHGLASGFVVPFDSGGGGGDGGTPTSILVHDRDVPLVLDGHLFVQGTVVVPDGTTACAANVTVFIQRWTKGHWQTVKTAMTDANGVFRAHLRDRDGRYRIKIAASTLAADDICAAAWSRPLRHRS